MALLSSDFGNFSGKVGNVVLRTRNGKTYVASLPKEYTLSDSEDAVNAREQFALMAKMSKAAASNFVLNYFWKNSDYPGETVRNKFEKQNYHLVRSNDLSNLQLFMATDLFNVSIKEITVEGTVITVKINPLALSNGGDIFPLKTPLISSQGFIYLYKPNGVKDKFSFIPISSKDACTFLNEEITFTFNIKDIEVKQMGNYPEKKLLFNLALKDQTGRPTRCSGTIYYSIEGLMEP